MFLPQLAKAYSNAVSIPHICSPAVYIYIYIYIYINIYIYIYMYSSSCGSSAL